jgi:MYXO-CTERM domain-containing protein
VAATGKRSYDVHVVKHLFSRSFRSPAIAFAFATAYVALAACGENKSPESTGRTAKTASPLVADIAHYVGHSNLADKQLALTFDDGPSSMTVELSTYLQSEGIPAVFFMNGARIQATSLPNPNNLDVVPNATAILAQVAAAGHLIGNHTTTHRNLLDLADDERVQEISETNALITQYGRTPWNRSLIRPPLNGWSQDVESALQPTFANYTGPITPDIGTYHDRYPKAADDSACFGGGLTLEGGKLLHSDVGDNLPDGFATTDECTNGYLTEIAALGHGIVIFREGFSWSDGTNGGNTVALVKRIVPLLKSSGFTFVRADYAPGIAADLPACTAGCDSCNGSGDGQCIACAKDFYLANGSCTACAKCPAGTFTASACTATTATVCTPCDPDTYSAEGADACTSCATCNDDDPCTTVTCVPTGCNKEPIAGCTPPPPADDKKPAAAAPPADASGCSVAHAPSSSGASLAAFAALALTFGRRLRRRNSRQ